MKRHVSLVTACYHGLQVGDIVDIGGVSHVVTAVTRDTFAARRTGLLEQLWHWMIRTSIRVRGFWARVWHR